MKERVVEPVGPVGGAVFAPSKERWETRSVFHGSGRIRRLPVRLLLLTICPAIIIISVSHRISLQIFSWEK